MYGSIFCRETLKPRASSSAPMAAAARPLPSDETTPPVTKMYFDATSPSLSSPSPSRPPHPGLAGPLSHVMAGRGRSTHGPVEAPIAQLVEHATDPRPPRNSERDDLVAAEPRLHGGVALHEPGNGAANRGGAVEP